MISIHFPSTFFHVISHLGGGRWEGDGPLQIISEIDLAEPDCRTHIRHSVCKAITNHPYGYGSIPINTIFSGMNIHLPAILMFTRGTRFWHAAICSWFITPMICGWIGDGLLLFYSHYVIVILIKVKKNLHELDTKLMACLIAWILKLLMSWITNDTCNLWWSIARTIIIESSLDQMNRRDTPKLNGLLSLLGLLKSCDKPHNKNRRAHRAFDHHVSGGLKKQIHNFKAFTSTNAGTSSTILKW